ncbi:hypothetical protein LTS18_009469, partial [Coniosporium uncinatum]
MSFSIEAAGEAAPLNLQNLTNTLQSASSSNAHQIKAGASQLGQWETRPSFHASLQTVFLSDSLPFEVRYLAIIQLKNGIDKYWRKTAPNAVSKDEKTEIRERLLLGVNEPDRRLSLQNALVTAKVVRYEFPSEWPDVMTRILSVIRESLNANANPLHLPGALRILLKVVKELATGRLARTKTSLQSVTPEIFHVLGNIYIDKVNRWQGFLHNGGDGSIAFNDIQNSLLLIKVIRRLLIAGYEFPNRDSEVTEFWGLVTDKLAQFLQTLSAVGVNMSLELRMLIEKNLINLSKLHHEMCSTHPAAFILLPGSIQLVGAYWSLITDFGNVYNEPSPLDTLFTIGTDGDADPDERSVGEKLSLKGLQIVRLCVKMVHNPTKSFKYRQPQEKEEKAQATSTVKSELLTNGF